MNLIQTNALTEKQTADVRLLEETCRAYDGLKGTVFLSNELNFNPEIDCYYLLYHEENQLAAFLTIFLPTQKEAEVSAFTVPELRRRGYFHTLLKSVQAKLKPYDVSRFLFVTEPQSADAAAVLSHYEASREYSEYLMAYDCTRRSQQQINSPLRLECVSDSEVEEITQLNVLAFHDTYEESRSMVEKSLQSSEMDCYCAVLNGKIIGVCNVNLEEDTISIYGLAIYPEEQGKGWGRQVLALLLDRLTARENRKITLEVSSTNSAAYHLYLTSGFRVKTQFDYSPGHFCNTDFS